MLIVNNSELERTFIFILFKYVFSLPIRNSDNRIALVSRLETTTKKSFICPWYCYPAIIFSILIGLILITICISACDYRYLKKDQELNAIQQKTVSLDNRDVEEKSISEKVSQKSEDDDDDSITSTDSEKV
jgi:hypothetical protein